MSTCSHFNRVQRHQRSTKHGPANGDRQRRPPLVKGQGSSAGSRSLPQWKRKKTGDWTEMWASGRDVLNKEGKRLLSPPKKIQNDRSGSFTLSYSAKEGIDFESPDAHKDVRARIFPNRSKMKAQMGTIFHWSKYSWNSRQKILEC